MLLVFLVLAALYESSSLPLVVILIVPMCLLCAILGVLVTGGDNNIFTQIGLIVLVGLACKNAILIVEFAKDREAHGRERVAGRARCLPAASAADSDDLARVRHGRGAAGAVHGAGAEMRHAMGVAVFSGMLGVTFFGLLLTPVFYLLVRRRRAKRLQKTDGDSTSATTTLAVSH